MARGQPGQGHDPSRREFFRTFSRQTVQNAGAVVGAASELRRTSVTAARQILDLDASRAAPDDEPSGGTTPEATFRSAYRVAGDALVILDQRELPARALTFECRHPSEVAAAMRSGAVTGGPVLGEIGAHALALAAAYAVDRSDAGREQGVRAAVATLRAARPDVRALAVAIARMEARYDSLVNGGAGAREIADGLAAEADAISTAATHTHAQIGRHAAVLLEGLRTGDRSPGAALDVLIHADGGPLACGLVGMSTTCFRAVIDASRPLHVWVTAAAPSGEGARVAAHQLAQLDIAHTVIPDSAVGWLLANRQLDAAFLRGDTIGESGDVVALVGALSVARLAAGTGVPVVVLGPSASIVADGTDLRQLTPAVISAAESGAARRARLNPTTDLVPGELIAAWVTEQGVIRATPLDGPR